MTEWMFKGTHNDYGEYFPEDAVWDEGEWAKEPIRPQELIDAWGPWVKEVTIFLDGDGAFKGDWKEPGVFGQQPALDMAIYQIIRGRWVELRNEEIKRSGKGQHNRSH